MNKNENYRGFAVKHCIRCNYAWEKEGNKQLMYYDFPKYGLQKKTCNECLKEEKREREYIDA